MFQANWHFDVSRSNYAIQALSLSGVLFGVSSQLICIALLSTIK
jgi:hypothetical protein